MVAFIGLVMIRAIPLFRAMQVKLDRINQVMRETLAGVRVIRAFVRTGHEELRFDDANGDLFETSLGVNRLFAVTIPMMTAILNLSTVAVMWFGAIRVNCGDMPIGNLTAFLQYLMQILFSVLMAVFMFVFVPRAAVSAGRIQEVLETEPMIRDPEEPVPMPARGTGRAPRLDHRVPRRRVPLSGRGGAGPPRPELRRASRGRRPPSSAAPAAASRRWSTSSRGSTTQPAGAVLVDGVDVRDMTRTDLWDRIGLIPQKAFLFSGTVASNLRYGDEEATDEDLWRALDIAQGRDFVTDMEGQLEAPITQGGTNVSGGQRQRLAIARALVKQAPIYIFDDSFSALDFATDARLRAALRHELGWATVIIVAQRVGTIMHADRIVVMDAGRIVGIGTHAELLASNETYQEIVYSQLIRGRGGGMSGDRGGGPVDGPGGNGRPAGRSSRRWRRAGRPPRSSRAGRSRPRSARGMMGGMIGCRRQARRTSAASFSRLIGHLRPEAPLIVAGHRAWPSSASRSPSSARRSWATRPTTSSRASSASSSRRA